MHALNDTGAKHVYPDTNDDTEFNRLCSKQIDETVRSFFYKMGMITVSFMICVSGPAYAYFFKGMRTTTTDVKLPYTEPGSNVDFFANIVLQCTIASHGGLAYFGVEVLVSLVVDIVTFTPKIVEFKLADMSKRIKDKSLTHPQIRLIVADIAAQTIDSERYDFIFIVCVLCK